MEAAVHPEMALERITSSPPAELISDDEIRRLFRVAEALARSGMFKDISKAEQAFAKMIVGRDLGLTPAQSLQGLHIVKGGVMVHYAMLAQFVRAHVGYDFRAGWIKQDAPVEGEQPSREPVWMDEEDPLDMRDTVGAFVVFTVHGRQAGVSRFTMEDAATAKLVKPDSAWTTAPRNMLLARSMSNGVKWFVPEVLNGLPIYVDGELPTRADVSAGVGTGEGAGIDLGPKVDAIIERAGELGHAALSNREAIEVQLGSRAPHAVNEWVAQAKRELDELAAQQAEPEPVDAEVVEPDDAESTSDEPESTQDDLTQPQEGDTMVVTLLRSRLKALETTPADEDAEALSARLEEIVHVEQQLADELGDDS